jgi:phage terminase large subunit
MNFPELTEKQITAFDILVSQKYKEILFSGASRAGKTFVILFFCFCVAIKYPGIRILITRLRFAHVKANIWLQDIPKLISYSLFKKTKLNKQDYIATIGQSQIWIGGLDDKERTEKILGQEYGLIFLNESVQIPISSRDMIKTRLAQKIDGWKNLILYDCNPRHPLHYIYQEFYVKKDKKKCVLNWVPEDNIENLPEDYIKECLDTLSADKKKRFRDGVWAPLPGNVYVNVKAENIIEVNQDFEYYDECVGGIDFGLYTAVNIWGIKENRAYLLREIILQGAAKTTTKNIIKELDNIEKIKYYGIVIYCDHEPDRINELEEAGYYAGKAYKDVSAGDASVNEYELYFDNNCPCTFQSMLNLANQTDNNNAVLDKHIKENDHEADCARYALHGYKIDNHVKGAHFFSNKF